MKTLEPFSSIKRVWSTIREDRKGIKTRAHVFVSGRDEGVFFRLETKRKEDSHGVTECVRNLPDSHVEAVFDVKQKPLGACGIL